MENSVKKIEVGDTIVAMVFGERITGVVENIDEHKGQTVYDIEGTDRYVFERQVVRVIKKK